MPLNVRFEDDIVVLSNFGPLLNDPSHFDAGRDVREILDRGYRRFIFELAGLRDMGSTAIGLLTTLTRLIRQHRGDAVLARAGRGTADYIRMMRMDAYWEILDSVDEAKDYLRGPSA